MKVAVCWDGSLIESQTFIYRDKGGRILSPTTMFHANKQSPLTKRSIYNFAKSHCAKSKRDGKSMRRR